MSPRPVWSRPRQGHHVSGRCHLPWSAPSRTLVLPFLVYSGKPALRFSEEWGWGLTGAGESAVSCPVGSVTSPFRAETETVTQQATSQCPAEVSRSRGQKQEVAISSQR